MVGWLGWTSGGRFFRGFFSTGACFWGKKNGGGVGRIIFWDSQNLPLKLVGPQKKSIRNLPDGVVRKQRFFGNPNSQAHPKCVPEMKRKID